MFEYCAKYYDMIDEKECYSHGAVFADSWGEAMMKIGKYYSEDTLMEVHINAVSEDLNGIVEYIDGVESIQDFLII